MKAAEGKDSRSGAKIKRAQSGRASPMHRKLKHRGKEAKIERRASAPHTTRCANQPSPAHNTAWDAPRRARALHDQRAAQLASGTTINSKAI